ncbi:MAG: hypothetical protein JW874_14895 [Spirochaetales bacterium]|nr:hypothetical protein [Spirochaetales bacterium]
MIRYLSLIPVFLVCLFPLAAETPAPVSGGMYFFQNANVSILEEQVSFRNGTLSQAYILQNTGAGTETLYAILPVDGGTGADPHTAADKYRLHSTLNSKTLNWTLRSGQQTAGLPPNGYALVSDIISFPPGGKYTLSINRQLDPLTEKDAVYGNSIFRICYRTGNGLKKNQAIGTGFYYFYLPVEGLTPKHSQEFGPFPVFGSGDRQWGPYVGFLDTKSNLKFTSVEYKLNEVLVKYEYHDIASPLEIDLSWCNRAWEGCELPYFDDFTDPDVHNLLSGYPYYNRLDMFQNRAWFIRFLLFLSEYLVSGKHDYAPDQAARAKAFVINSLEALHGKVFPAGPAADFYCSLAWYKASGYSEGEMAPWARAIIHSF